MPKVRADFYITGTVDLDKISEALKLEPTVKRKKEDFPQPSIDAGFAKDVWSLSTMKEECLDISDQLDKLRKVLIPKVETVIWLCQNYTVVADVVIVVDMEIGDGPVFELSRENIHFFSSINATIGFDLYIDVPDDYNDV